MKKLMSMKQKSKIVIAVCLVCTMCLGGSAFAASSVTHVELNPTEETNQNVTPVSDNGMCGDNMKWDIDESGTLRISGGGKMYNYVDIDKSENTIPWLEKNDAAAIKNVIIEDGVETISDMALYGTAITDITLPDSVNEIGISVLANCKNLKSVRLSDNIKTIPEGAFNCDDNLEEVYLPANLQSIDESAFIHCFKLRNITIPSGVKEIKETAFWDCPLLDEIIIPDGVTNIESRSFDSCVNLRQVIFSPNIKAVGDHAFVNCANIEEIILPDGLTQIGEYAFSYVGDERDSGLPRQKVYIPDSVQQIGKGAIDINSVIYGLKNSVAETYAKDNNIEFVEVTDSLYSGGHNESTETPMPTAAPEQKTLTVQGGEEIKISVDGEAAEFDAKPFIDDNGRTQVPVRAVSELVNCKVDWNQESQTAVIEKDNGDTVKITLGSDIMLMNDNQIKMDTAAQIKDDRTYIPVRFVAEALGLTVNWIE